MKRITPAGFFGYLVIASLLFAPISLLAHTLNTEEIPSVAPVIERSIPAVVNIATQRHQKQKNSDENGKTRNIVNLGSGFIFNAEKGYIATNFHVVQKAHAIWVTLNDGRRFPATLIGGDDETDIAVIQIEAPDLTAIPFYDSDKVRTGDFVLALGSPFGLRSTVTSGIVSGIDRSNLGIKGFEDFIQTDASINPGNSGGALINLKGALIGMNTAILSRSGGNIGVGFAIPSNMVAEISEQLIEYGDVKRGTLGIKLQNISNAMAKNLGLRDDKGAMIVEVQTKSPSENAGLKAGDIILKINKKTIKDPADVRNAIGTARLGADVHINYWRDGEQRQTQLKLTIPMRKTWAIAKLYPALSGAYFSPAKAGRSSIEGVEVVKVSRPSRAWQVGLRPGDIITGLNKHPINNLDSFKQLVTTYAGGDMVFKVKRGKHQFYLVMRRV